MLRRVCATIALVGVVVYVVVDVVLQFLPPHYSAIRDAESDLAVGPFGWVMSINFFGRGVTSAATIVAISGIRPRTGLRDTGLTLFAIAGFCSALIAFFPTDISDSGVRVTHPTAHGTVHLIGASAGFIFALAGLWLLTRWVWRTDALGHARGAATVFIVVASAGLLYLAVTILWLPQVFGLAERVCLAGILGWVFVVVRGVRAPISPGAR